MKLALAAVLALLASPALADPVEGLWQTQPDDGAYAHVQVSPCGAGFCGTIVKSYNAQGEYASPNVGKQLIRNMAPQGNGKYEGQVWRPSNNKIYAGKLTLSGNSLKMQGCIAGGLLCSSQTWSRVR